MGRVLMEGRYVPGEDEIIKQARKTAMALIER